MLGSLAKVIGLSVASLGSFNLPTKQAQIQTTVENYDVEYDDNYDWSELQERGYNEGTPEQTNYAPQYSEQSIETYEWWAEYNEQTYTSIQYRYRTQRITGTSGVALDEVYQMYVPEIKAYSYVSYLLLRVNYLNDYYQQTIIENISYDINELTLINNNLDEVDFKMTMYTTSTDQWEHYLTTHTTDWSYYAVSKDINAMIQNNNVYDLQTYYLNETTLNYNITQDSQRRLMGLENDQENITKRKPLYILITMSMTCDNYTVDKINSNFKRLELSIEIQDRVVITQEVIDVPGLMFTILTMPFTFLSTAFNLTIFPGTPYQLNISAFFLAILGIVFFIFILKLILGKVK